MDKAAFLDHWTKVFNAQDLAGFLDLCTEDARYISTAFGLAVQGRDAVRQVASTFVRAVPDRIVVPERHIVDGDFVAMVYRYWGTSAGLPDVPQLPPEGDPADLLFCAVLSFHDGRIAEHFDYQG